MFLHNKKNRSWLTHLDSPQSGYGSMGELEALYLSKAMDRLLSMQVFERVVAEGGFAAAARTLDLSPAVVSRLVGDLEEHLDTRLIQRTTRKFALTESGNVYLQKLKVILQEVSDASVAAQNCSGVMTGTLHILATPLLASLFLAPLAAAWRTQYPQVTLDVSVDPFPYMRVEEFDLTLMLVEENFNADIVARVLGRSERLLCAAPSYLSLGGTPKHPRELRNHVDLRFSWHLAPGHTNGHSICFNPKSENTDPVVVEMNGVLHSVCMDVLLKATISGAGLSLLPEYLVRPYLREGSLVHVLPQWTVDGLTVYAALPTRKFVPARVTAMFEFVTQAALEAFPAVMH